MRTGISHSLTYSLWDAAIAAGATLDEMFKVYRGKYPVEFLEHVVAWHRSHTLIRNHANAAASSKAKKK